MKLNLTPREIKCIEQWLKRDRYDASYRCPFAVKASDGDTKCKGICFRIFPSLKQPRCPCGQFGDLYVRQVAEKIVEEFSKEGLKMHECPRCGRPTDGSYSEVCDDCMHQERQEIEYERREAERRCGYGEWYDDDLGI